MLTIKDLAANKELTAKEMASTFGGSSFGNINGSISGGAVVLGDGNKTRVDNSVDNSKHDSHNSSSSYSSTYKSGGFFGGWF